MRAGVLVAIAASVGACASSPDVEDRAVPPAAAAAPAPSAPPAASVAHVSSAEVVTDAPPLVAKARPGYRAKSRNGEAVYCRSETPTGSKLLNENCYTEVQLEEIERQAEEIKDGINRQRVGTCGQLCGGGNN